MSEPTAPRLEVADGLQVRGHKPFPIRHLHFFHGVSVEHEIITDNSSLLQQKRRKGIHLIVRERPLVKSWHGAVDKVPNGRGKRPRLYPAPGTLGPYDARTEDAAFLPGGAMTHSALGSEDGGALLWQFPFRE